MHEIGTLSRAIEEIEKVALENKIENIKVVTFQIGEASGYITKFFTDYFPIITSEKPLFKDCELKIIQTKAEAVCLNCHTLYNVMKQKGVCPRCGSREKEMIGGQEFLIKELVY